MDNLLTPYYFIASQLKLSLGYEVVTCAWLMLTVLIISASFGLSKVLINYTKCSTKTNCLTSSFAIFSFASCLVIYILAVKHNYLFVS
jgi:hypothetical protein